MVDACECSPTHADHPMQRAVSARFTGRGMHLKLARQLLLLAAAFGAALVFADPRPEGL